MEAPDHSLNTLFDQLGLENSDQAIELFIEQHKPLASGLLSEAGFWTASQADFLKQAVADDADWVNVVDHLDSMLR